MATLAPNPYPPGPPPPTPLIIFGPQYALPYETWLLSKKKFSHSREIDICDSSGVCFFKINHKALSLHNKRCVYNSLGNPVCCIKQKAFSLHGVTYVYSGDEMKDANIACTIRRVMMSQSPQAQVFFKTNTTKTPDLLIVGDKHKKEFIIQNQSGSILCEAGHKLLIFPGFQSDVSKRTYFVRVLPHVDAAFVIALVSVAAEMFHKTKARTRVHSHHHPHHHHHHSGSGSGHWSSDSGSDSGSNSGGGFDGGGGDGGDSGWDGGGGDGGWNGGGDGGGGGGDGGGGGGGGGGGD